MTFPRGITEIGFQVIAVVLNNREAFLFPRKMRLPKFAFELYCLCPTGLCFEQIQMQMHLVQLLYKGLL